MVEALPYMLLSVLAAGAWFAGLVLLDVFTTEDVRAWRRLAALRGYMTVRTRLERAAERSSLVRRLRVTLDLDRALAIAQREQTPLGFLMQTLALVLFVFSAVLITDAAGHAVLGSWPISAWWAVALAVAIAPLSVLELRAAARRARERIGRALTDMTMMLAVMTDARGFQLDEAVRIMSRCADEHTLAQLVGGGYRRLVSEPHPTTVALYRAIADHYGISQFRQLADAAAASNVGLPERTIYTRVALAMYDERLASARLGAARARILVTLPVAGMLLPLLVLIGAPTLSALSGGF